MHKYIIESDSTNRRGIKVYYETDFRHNTVWTDRKENAKIFDTYADALGFGQINRIKGIWQVVVYDVNKKDPIGDAYDRAMRGI